MIRSLSTLQHTILAAPAHDGDHGDHVEDSGGGGAGAGLLHSEVKFPLRAGQVSLSRPCPPCSTVSNTQVGRRKVTVDRDGDRVKLACVNWWEQPH